MNAATCQLPDDDARVQMENMYKQQVEHLTEQQTLSMGELRVRVREESREREREGHIGRAR